jgi:uncharacterized membrane protein
MKKVFLKLLQFKLIILILFLGIFLRVISISQSFWLDEAIGGNAIKIFDVSGIITQFSQGDNHPPLFYATLKVWANTFGYTDISLRLLSILFGILTLIFFYKLARRLLKEWKIESFTFPLIATLLLATSNLHVYYSQEVRMYGMAAFLTVFSSFYYLKTLSDVGKKKIINWVMFSLGVTALVFTDYMPVFMLPVFPIYALVRKSKVKNWWYFFIASFIPLAILGFFWLPIFKIQSQGGKWLMENLPLWRTVAGGANLKQLLLVGVKFTLGRLSFPVKPLYYSLGALAIAPYVFIFSKSILQLKRQSFAVLWLFVPLALGFLVSIFFPAFIFFRYIFVLPAFYLILAYGINLFNNPIIRYFLVSLLVTINLATVAIYTFDTNQQRENWKKAVETVESRIKPDEAVAFENLQPFAPYTWYSKGNVQIINTVPSIGATDAQIRFRTNAEMEKYKGIYLFEYLRDINDSKGIASNIIESGGFELTGTLGGFNGVGQIDYFTRP